MRQFEMYILFALILLASRYTVDGFFQNIKVDPEFYMTTTQVIRYNNYPCENHNVQTEDGYILNLQRIPFGVKNKTTQNRPVAFLQHGLIDSSFTWVNNHPNQSLGFILADAGFDVWLANSRGNVYSDKHVKYTTKSRLYWDFSFDEMAKYDLPASVDYVLKVTGAKKLSYIGHSQGTLIGFIEFSKDKSQQKNGLASKISSFSALAPVVYLGNVESAIKYFSRLSGGFQFLFDLFSHGAFLPSSKFTDELAKLVCGATYTRTICSHIVFLLAGYDPSNLNMTRLPVYVSHTPAGTSAKNMVHFAQGYDSNKFQMFDYGLLHNIWHYGSRYPTQYTLKPSGIPIAMFWGGSDKLADPADVFRAIKLMDNEPSVYIEHYYESTYDHMDFIWGENAANLIYKDLIKFMKKNI